MKNVRLYGQPPYRAAVIHGGPGALGTVAAIARELSKDLGVIEPLQTKTSIEELLTELDDTLTDDCDRPITLIGHSWGAWLVLMYAARYPQRVNKVILVGSGPFEASYIPQIAYSRVKRLADAESIEFEQSLMQLESEKEARRDALLKRIGELADKCDNYCKFDIATDKEDCLPVEAGKFSAVWKEATALRRNGELLALAGRVQCPVVAIHGKDDPHPADGVKLPLEGRIKEFDFYLLDKCGHYPWKEKYAHEKFYEILRKEIL